MLRAEATVLPPLLPSEVRIRTIASGVNFTDLQIRAGNWPIKKIVPFPYTPGVEVVGVVEDIGDAVTTCAPGQRVISMMQGLGGVRAERPGGYAEFVTVAAHSIAAVPDIVNPMDIAALGLGAVTACNGLAALGALAGRRVLVTGSTGGVGSAAVAIARIQGASVIALVSRPENVASVREVGADEVVVAPRGSVPPLPPASVDYVLDVVGGPGFGACVNALRDGGALVLVGAVGGGDVSLDAWQFIRPVTLTGYSTESLDGAQLRRAVVSLSGWMSAGVLPKPRYVCFPLSAAAEAHAALEKGAIKSRVLLTPDGSHAI